MKKYLVLLVVFAMVLSACSLTAASDDRPPIGGNTEVTLADANDDSSDADEDSAKTDEVDADEDGSEEDAEDDSDVVDAHEDDVDEADVVCPTHPRLDLPEGVRVNEDEDTVYSYSYDLTQEDHELYVPCGFTVTVASGTITIDDVEYPADEDEGNVNYSTCEEEAGCTYILEEYEAGHVGVTLANSQNEPANVTLYNAVYNMFQADSGNCGSNACNTVYAHDLDEVDEDVVFESAPESEDDVVAAYEDIAFGDVVVVGNMPDLSENLYVGKNIVGYAYEWHSDNGDTHYVGVSESASGEAHGVVLYCDGDYVVDGYEVPAESIALLIGNDTDGKSPQDLNWTAKVVLADETSCEVYYIHADDVNAYVDFPAVNVDVYVFGPGGSVGIQPTD